MRSDVYQEVTNQILAALERGVVPWRNPILGRTTAGLPTNLHTGRSYRGTNVFLLALIAWAEGYDSPYWLTFRQAQQRGGHIRKGEKSTVVVFWKQITLEDKKTKLPTRVPVLRHYRVFNTEQCDALDVGPVTHTAPQPFEPIVQAESIVKGYEGPTVKHIGSGARYLPALDEVRMPEPDRFESPALFYATLFHELVHSTGHSRRLDRGLDTTLAPFGSPDYSREELVAEMGAAFLCGHAGISPATVENSAAYIQGWIKRLRDDKRLVVQAGSKAQKAADYVLGATQTTTDGDED
jgi:antirestriction protein ArdC